MTKQELIALCEKYLASGTAAMFYIILDEFIRLDPNSAFNELNHGFCVSKQIVQKWINGKNVPSPWMRRTIANFIRRRVKYALTIELNAQAVSITCQEIQDLFNQNPLPPLKEFFKKMRMAEAHILNCPACRAKYSTLATVADDTLNKK